MPVIKNYVIDDELNVKQSFRSKKKSVIKSQNIVFENDHEDSQAHHPNSNQGAKVTESHTQKSSPATVNSGDRTTVVGVSQESVDQQIQQVKADMSQQLKPHIDELMTAINGLQSARQDVIKKTEQKLVQLALEIAEKIIVKQVELDPTVLSSVFSDTLNKITGSDQVLFKINPEDMDVFNAFKANISTELIGVRHVSVSADPSIDRGGCILETNLGFIDVTIKEKLNLIAQTFEKIQQAS